MFTPDLKPMVAMAVARLNAISEAIGDGDKVITPKAAKDARRAKALIVEIIQQINDIIQAQKTATTKKTK